MYVIDLLLVSTIIINAVFWLQMSDDAFRVVPFDVTNGTMMMLEPYTWCIGTRSMCVYASGMASVNVPIRFNSRWEFALAPGGSLRLSLLDPPLSPQPMLYVNRNGGIVVGPDEDAVTPDTVVQMAATSVLIMDMWQSRSSVRFSDGSLMDAVCHVNDHSICGHLFRTTVSDAGIFRSATLTIIGVVEYGFITANLRAKLLMNSSVVITQYFDRGHAVPCCCVNETLAPACVNFRPS